MGKPSSLASTLSHAKVALLVVPNVVDKTAIAVIGIKVHMSYIVDHITIKLSPSHTIMCIPPSLYYNAC
jgi:hypothetical protein